MQIKKIIKLSSCVVLSAFLTNTYAQSAATHSNTTNNSTGFFVSLNALPIFAGGVDLGYLFTQHFGVQAGVFGFWSTSTGFDLENATIYDIAMRGVLPVGDHAEFFGKLGVGVISATENLYNPFVPNQILATWTAQSFGPTYALGFGYCFTKHWMASIQGTGIYSTGSQLIRSGFKIIPTVGVTYTFNS